MTVAANRRVLWLQIQQKCICGRCGVYSSLTEPHLRGPRFAVKGKGRRTGEKRKGRKGREGR